ncbi:right-handed parallel beta-helix repeat-containing protein, partial [uncultured Neisseria sp.]|uniref:right-handed parallel beta-helix repeat-containing protein n=1 Tax=uncultured Neisseria sp. TaxID=237778 RepID=UPI00262BDE89
MAITIGTKRPITIPSAPSNSIVIASAKTPSGKTYHVYQSKTHGRYIDAAEFGTDASGRTDSLPAIKNALKAAHSAHASVYLSGKLYVSDTIVIDKTLSSVQGIIGNGMGNTTISFNKAQKGIFNSDTNETDIRENAGILVDGVDGVSIKNLSVKYTHTDFYRKGLSYFGKVSGILVNDADNTLISGVEVSGANRAGVVFTSTAALQEDPAKKGMTFKARVQNGELNETHDNLPTGENNRIENSYLHHNRVAGALVSYQEDFVADNNTFSYNGHAGDGGTGYGIATMAGSYNFGVTFSNNRTDHNYRKGLDVHDGTDIVISNNISNGDRMYGIAVYNRQFAMENVKITGNTIIQDAKFRLLHDDNAECTYYGYSGIQLQTNTQNKNLYTHDNARYEISGNTISGLTLFKDDIHTYGIEFRNHENTASYNLDITGNTINGTSSRYLIAAINDTTMGNNAGLGSGNINISGNTAKIGEIAADTVPVYVEEKSA